MSKNPKNGSKHVQYSEPMNGTMKFFLAGCVAELYLLIIRKFYINGTAVQQIAWFDHHLFTMMGVGAAILALGVVLSVLWRADRRKRVDGWCVAGVGAFITISTILVRMLFASAMTFLCVLVPVVILLGIFWTLYDRECALSLTILGAGLMALWVCRSALGHTYVKVGAVVFLVALAVVALLVKQGKLQKLIPGGDSMPIYVACGLSALGVVIAFVSSSLAYYAMWALAIVIFALAVYYTVKQL